MSELSSVEKEHRYVQCDESLLAGESQFLLPPPSSGESSLCDSEEENAKMKTEGPSPITFAELCNLLVDSTLLRIDAVEPTKAQRDKKPPKEWKGVTELLWYGVDRGRRCAYEKADFERFLKAEFSQHNFIEIDRVRYVHYQGTQSALVRFKNENAAQFVYFNFHVKPHRFRENVGEHIQVLRVLENLTRKPPLETWAAVYVRQLPKRFTRESLLQEASKCVEPRHVEELLQIDEYKYGLVVTHSLDDAE